MKLSLKLDQGLILLCTSFKKRKRKKDEQGNLVQLLLSIVFRAIPVDRWKDFQTIPRLSSALHLMGCTVPQETHHLFTQKCLHLYLGLKLLYGDI